MSRSNSVKTEQEGENMDEFLVLLKVDETFHSYLMKILNQQLDAILNDINHLKTNPQTNLYVYDGESYNEKELFNYLSRIWTIFWQEISFLKCPNSECNKSNELYYCQECIKLKLIYIKILSLVWKIVFNKFSPKLNELFSFSLLDDSQAGLQSSNQSTVAVGILDCCRKFVDRCLSVHSKYTANSLKLANEIVNLMQDIGLSLSLQVSDYANLFKWTQTTFSGEYIGDPTLIKTLIRFFIFITWNKNSSGALMKYICHDLVFIFQISKENDSSNAAEQVFNCLTQDNVSQLIGVVYEELTNIIDLCDWFISFKSDYGSMIHLYKQIHTLIDSIKCLLYIDLQINSHQDSLIRLLTKFYNFMISLCKSIANRQINVEEENLIKAIVDFTAVKFQKPLSQFIKFIQNAKSSISKERPEKGNPEDKSKKQKEEGQTMGNKLIKCGKMIPNLVYLVEQYEQHLKLLNKHFKDRIDLTENFEKDRFRDFKIMLPDEDQNETIESTLNNTERPTNTENDEENQDEDVESDESD